MWLNLFILLLLVGVAFYQSIHGLFSGLIFCVVAIVSTALAFALYEFVAYQFLASWKPDFALPIALVACFAIPLIVGRVALDSLVKRAGLLPSMVDRAGGLAFGLITAMLCVGVLATAAQMVPFGGTFLAFSRFDRPVDEDEERDEQEHFVEVAEALVQGDDAHIWLSPDRFAAGMAAMLSDGVFSGNNSFRRNHPDLMVEIGWQQTVPVEARVVAKPDSNFQVRSIERTDYVHVKEGGTRGDPTVSYDPVPPEPGHEYWKVNFVPPSGAASDDNAQLFSLPQIRLVGADSRGDPRQFIPIAVRDNEAMTRYVEKVKRGREYLHSVFRLFRPAESGDLAVVFEVPDGFEPSFLTYKSSLRAQVSAPREGGTGDAADGDSTPSDSDDIEDRGTSSRRRGRSRRSDQTESRPDRNAEETETRSSGGRVTGARAQPTDSFFGDKLPVRLTDYERTSGDGATVTRGELREGSLYAFLVRQEEEGQDAPIERFAVPEGKRLLQLSAQSLRAGSIPGQVLNFATRTIRNYIVTDDRGNRYELAGRYAIADVEGDQVLELQYYPEQIGSVGRGIRDFDQIRRDDLDGPDATYVLLFLVDEGRQAVEFSTGRRGAMDLRPFNLVAE